MLCRRGPPTKTHEADRDGHQMDADRDRHQTITPSHRRSGQVFIPRADRDRHRRSGQASQIGDRGPEQPSRACRTSMPAASCTSIRLRRGAMPISQFTRWRLEKIPQHPLAMSPRSPPRTVPPWRRAIRLPSMPRASRSLIPGTWCADRQSVQRHPPLRITATSNVVHFDPSRRRWE